MNTEHWTGERYQHGRDVADVAKLVRKDIRAAGYPGTYSVRISRYSMGRSLTIEAKVPFPTRHGDLERENRERAAGVPCPWMTREGYVLQELLEQIGNAYNYNRSDSQTDYYDSAFHLDVRVDQEET